MGARVRDAVQEDEAQDAAADLLIREHDVRELVQGRARVAGGQADASEELVVAGDFFIREEPARGRQACGKAAADGDRVPVAPRVSLLTMRKMTGSAMKPHLMTSAAPAARSSRGSEDNRLMSATTARAG